MRHTSGFGRGLARLLILSSLLGTVPDSRPAAAQGFGFSMGGFGSGGRSSYSRGSSARMSRPTSGNMSRVSGLKGRGYPGTRGSIPTNNYPGGGRETGIEGSGTYPGGRTRPGGTVVRYPGRYVSPAWGAIPILVGGGTRRPPRPAPPGIREWGPDDDARAVNHPQFTEHVSFPDGSRAFNFYYLYREYVFNGNRGTGLMRRLLSRSSYAPRDPLSGWYLHKDYIVSPTDPGRRNKVTPANLLPPYGEPDNEVPARPARRGEFAGYRFDPDPAEGYRSYRPAEKLEREEAARIAASAGIPLNPPSYYQQNPR
jgi:hypothetical protein